MKKIILLIALAAFLGACSGISVKRDYDTSVNFQKLRTYAWQAHIINEPNKGNADNSLIGERVTTSADTALINKGCQKVLSGVVDFLVEYHYSVAKELEPESGVSTSVGIG